ncbi:hypothetical protein NG798_27270 [Ancylothrix sp. C2]|uniref:hypothetical protein n=1 Tax=Ancylothrix sp. D3o TaxID=2953691 RepID=UPI0021BB2B35|nr:hypothetical protein [Ancylothrix sp. D3o]MCT7953501.1 hypothetical protein [Ancylothrix sp. D3o]
MPALQTDSGLPNTTGSKKPGQIPYPTGTQKTCLVKDLQVIQQPTKNLPASVDYCSAGGSCRGGGWGGTGEF